MSERLFRRLTELGSKGVILFVLTASVLTGCGVFAPRPPVILTRSPTVIDYMDDEIEIDNTLFGLCTNRNAQVSFVDDVNSADKNASLSEKQREKEHRDRVRILNDQEMLLRSNKAPLEPSFFDPYEPLVKEYRLAPGDMLEISIFGNADTVINEVVIAPDGRLYYMFLEGILAAGKTVQELRAEITDKVRDYFIEPEVSIIPRRVSGQEYMILGVLNYPGLYPLNGATTLQQAIGNAGGIALGGYAGTTINIANLRGSFIVRDGKKLDVDFERLLETDGFEDNIYVRPGDYIYVASSLNQYVYLLGEVRENMPIPWKDGLTLAQLLAGSAGSTEGWTDNAWITRVIVVRGRLECPCWYEVNMLQVVLGEARDVYLLPGDLVYVQKKPFGFARELVRLAIESYVSGFGGTAGIYYGTEWFRP